MNIKELSISYLTITKKEISRFFRIWSQTFLPNIVTTILYFLIFGKVIGNQIKQIDGFSYIEYIMPGLVMMSVIISSYSNTASSFFSSKFQKSIEEVLVSSAPYYIILLGYVTGGVIRGMISGMLVLAVSLFFVKLKITSIGVVFLVLLLAAIIFSITGVINGIFAQNFDDIAWIPSFVLTPLSYLGGVFYSIKNLTGIWKKLSFFNPIFYIIDTLRYGILGIKILDIKITIIVSVVLITTLWLISLWLMKIKLQK